MTINLRSLAVAAVAAGLLGAAGIAIAEECAVNPATHNDYPTATRGDYIYGCMMVNGQTRDILDKCACSIDVIASVLPYQEYEEAETILAVRQRGGENVAFLFNPASREKVNNMKRAQIEGELRCF